MIRRGNWGGLYRIYFMSLPDALKANGVELTETAITLTKKRRG